MLIVYAVQMKSTGICQRHGSEGNANASHVLDGAMAG